MTNARNIAADPVRPTPPPARRGPERGLGPLVGDETALVRRILRLNRLPVPDWLLGK